MNNNNNNFNDMQNGMNPVPNMGPNPVPNPVQNDISAMANNVVNPNVNVVPTTPAYVENSMLNNNVSVAPNVVPVVENNIVGVENNESIDNRNKTNKLISLFLVILGVVVCIFALNTDSILFGGNSENIIAAENYQEEVPKYINAQDEKNSYLFNEVNNNRVSLVLNSKLDRDKGIFTITPDLLEEYSVSSDCKIYNYTVIKIIQDGVEIESKEEVKEFTLEELKEYTEGTAPKCYVEFKGKKVIQIVLYNKTNIYKYE